MNPGILYGVGLGPGDPELVTVKAARVIGAADVVAYHSARHGKSIARRIAEPYLRAGQTEEHLVYPVTTETVERVEKSRHGTVTTLASGKRIPAETVMYSAGRQGQTDQLDLANAGLESDDRGRIFVDDKTFQTKVDHIYAVGDVIGFPALAATSMEQGRLAAYHAFGEPTAGITTLQPIGIYSIPEVSYVGATEVELTKDAVPYEVGVSRYRELARGQIAGDSYGMLKLLVSTEDLTLLGVHIFGTNATEMVHIGQAVMGCGGTVEYLVDAVFNYPTFSEAYKVAALDVMNKMRALNQFRT